MKALLMAKHSESRNLESTKTEDIFQSRSEDTIAHYNDTVCSVDLDLDCCKTDIDFGFGTKRLTFKLNL